MKKDNFHIPIRDNIHNLISTDNSIEDISKKLNLQIGSRFVKGSVKWYIYCIKMKENQKKAIEKYPNLYSFAGKIAQQKHPAIGKNLGKKYGLIQGKINAQRLKGNSEYFSKMAKILQQTNPSRSKENMIKAHETMKKRGIFNEHQKLAALKCKEKNPFQLKEMSKKAHSLYPLALLALESHRKNCPYKFMNCLFDSNDEKIICQKLIEKNLIEKPIEKTNIHFRVNKCHIDFFIQNKLFIEFHPPRKFGKKIETEETYYNERRDLLNKNGFEKYPLIVISNLKEADIKIEEAKRLIHSL